MATQSTVTGPVQTPFGATPDRGYIRFQLTDWDAEGGTVITTTAVEEPIDVDTQDFSASLWASSEGDRGVNYKVTAVWYYETVDKWVEDDIGYCEVGTSGPYALGDILVDDPIYPADIDYATAAATSAAEAAGYAADVESAVSEVEDIKDATALIAQTQGAYTDTTIAAAISDGVAALTVGDTFTATGDDVDYIGLYVIETGPVATELWQYPKTSAIDFGPLAERYFARELENGFASFGGNTRVASTTPGEDGFLTAWEVYIVEAGDGSATLFLMDPTETEGTYTNIRSHEVTGLTSGLNTVSVPEEFDGTMLAGSVVAFAHETGQAQIAFASGGSDYTVNTTSPSGTMAFDPSANTFMVRGVYVAAGSTEYRLRSTELLAEQTSEKVDVLAENMPQPKDRVILNDTFEELPSGWTASGSWTYSSDGAHSPSTGDYSTYLTWDNISSLDRSIKTARVKIDDDASVFAILTRNGASGLVAQVDLSAMKLILYNESLMGVTPSYVGEEIAIPFSIVEGRDYLIEVRKDIDERNEGEFQTFTSLTFTDTITGDTATVKDYFSVGGMHWGNLGFQFSSGDVTLKRFTYASLMPRSPHIAVLGHSFVEGNTIFTTRQLRWAQLAVDYVGGDGMISGWGGANSENLLERLGADFEPFWPKYVFLDVTANDSVYATWLSNMQSIISRVEAKGSTPILMTAAPRADRQSFINSANAWIKSSGYAYVDQASALTDGHDGVAWNPAYEYGDGVHPNAAGHAAIFAQALIDVPWAFEA